MPSLTRRSHALVVAALTVGCLPEAVPSWLLSDARLMVIEQTIVATGALSTPLDEDPPGVRRREGLPGDRMRLEAFFAGPDGPVEPVGEPLWIRSPLPYIQNPSGATIEPCPEDGIETARLCRVIDDTLTLVPVPIGGFQGAQENYVYFIASTSAEYDAEACLDFYFRGGEGERFGCHFTRERLSYGPDYRVQELAAVEVTAPELEPDYYAESLRVELTFNGPGRTRSQTAEFGDTVIMGADETLTVQVAADETDLQLLNPEVERTERLYADFFASAPVLPETPIYGSARRDQIAAPDDRGAYIYAVVHEDGRVNTRSESLQWFYFRVVLGDPEVPPP